MKSIYNYIVLVFALLIGGATYGQGTEFSLADVQNYTVNPYKTMHIVVQEANINGVGLAEGDEVAVFHNDICLDTVVVKSAGVNGTNVLVFDVSATYEEHAADLREGFVEGDEIAWQIWDKSENVRYFNNRISAQYMSAANMSNVFTENGTAVVTSLSATSYFNTVWTTTPYTPMNLVVTTAEIGNGDDLVEGDEIGVYDTDEDGNYICVGRYYLADVIAGSIQIVLSADDPETPEQDGFIDDGDEHYLILRIYDASEDKIYYAVGLETDGDDDYNDVVYYDALATVTGKVRALEVDNQSTTVTAGWNIISYYVEDVQGAVVDDDLQDILELNSTGEAPDPVYQFVPVAGYDNPNNAAPELVKIMDEQGGFIEYISGLNYVNTIDQMQVSEGYYLKVDEGSTNLLATGNLVVLPDTIALQTGWNIMGYPVREAQAADNILAPLKANNTLIKLMDESGNFIQHIDGYGWINTLLDEKLYPGEGYYVKVSENTEAIFDYPAAAMAPVYQENIVIRQAPNKSVTDETHFEKVWNVDNPFSPMNFVISTNALNGFDMNIGDELAVFDGENCVGMITFTDLDSELYTFIAAADDPTTEGIDGFVEGNAVDFRYWNSATQTESNPSLAYVEGTTSFVKLGTFVGDFLHSVPENAMNETKLSSYPNPFSNTTTISFELANADDINLNVYDIYGKTVQTLAQGSFASGEHTISFDAGNLSKGIYFVNLQINGTNQAYTVKLIVQ